MNRLVVVATCLLGICAGCLGQETLVQWEFETEGDTEGWLPAHSLAPLTVAGGALTAQCTGPDPYMHASEGAAFDLQGNDFQYIEIRMRTTQEGGAEFFWANTTEGRDQGFVAGKERGFAVIGDGQWHVYHVYPLWQGQVTRLRFDPPEGVGATYEIDYIRIIQGPPGEHDPASPRWDFTRSNGGWVAASGGTHLAVSAEGVRTELLDRTVSLVGPPVDLKADSFQYLHLQLAASAPVTAILYWSATADGSFPACNAFSFDVPAGLLNTNLRLAGNPLFAGQIRRLSLSLVGSVGTQITLKQLALSDRPLGPAQLRVVSFAPRQAVVPLARPVRVIARLENVGGETLPGANLSVTVSGGGLRRNSQRERTIRGLGAGETVEVGWDFTPTDDGPAAVTLVGPGCQATARFIVTRSFPTIRDLGTLSAQVTGDGAWIGNDRTLLVLVKAKGAFSRGTLFAMQGGKPTLMATLPFVASVMLAGDPGPSELLLTQATPISGAQEASLRLSGATKVGDTTFRLTVVFRLPKDKPVLDATYDLTADRDAAIVAFRGPWLWAGEGAFGDQQDQALFPGLEYLVAGERSSSTLDIAAPANLRFAPHPNMITVPSMAVEKNGAIVGLMWDPLQKWDGEHCKPTAVFASPNFVEGYPNHLMGLCLPSIPDWMNANELVAARPYELRAGKVLSLAAAIYAEADSHLLRSMELYLDRFGIPDLPPKPRSYQETVAMSLRAYEDILWKEEARGWMGVIGWAAGPNQTVALQYLTASRLLKATRDQPWVERLQAKGISLADPSELGWSLHHFGNPAGPQANALCEGRARAMEAPRDGKYTFKPTENTRCLGSEGATESGINAGGVMGLLDLALRTGDRAPLDAARPTLELLRQFKVPRASQVWEVPVHTPDILASAQCCLAYVKGYQLTGDPQMLKQAVYWAKTGLPFVYLWQAPEQKPLMKGATIPVFGASMYVASWFGVPVQWNGLEYARALLELARFDNSLPWRHFAEMITISAMNMQSTRESDYGCYTDNWNVVKDVECTVCMLAPGGIVTNVLTLLDAPAGVSIEVVRAGESPICINAAPRISNARLANAVLEFSLRYEPDLSAYATVMPIAEPTQVEVDGAELAKRPTLAQDPEGWSYRPDIGCLTLKLQFGTSPRSVRIIKARAIEPKLPAPEWEFDAEGDTGGWSAAHDVVPLKTADGKLTVEVTGGDPYIHSPRFMADAKQFPIVAFRAKVTAPNGQLFFATDKGGISEAQSVIFELPADGEFHEVRLDMSGHPRWTGLVTQLRLDFAAAPCGVEIDWVRLMGAGTGSAGEEAPKPTGRP